MNADIRGVESLLGYLKRAYRGSKGDRQQFAQAALPVLHNLREHVDRTIKKLTEDLGP